MNGNNYWAAWSDSVGAATPQEVHGAMGFVDISCFPDTIGPFLIERRALLLVLVHLLIVHVLVEFVLGKPGAGY
jgi:hypothetical protein